MAHEQCLVLIKPDGLVKSLTGNIITALSETKLKIVGAKIVKVSKELAELHYAALQLKKPHIFDGTVKYLMGLHHTERVLALVYSGEDAIEKIRTLAGSTNPEEADPASIRGRYGRINSKTGVMENVLHASDSAESSEREIKIWFQPKDLSERVYPVEKVKHQVEEEAWS